MSRTDPSRRTLLASGLAATLAACDSRAAAPRAARDAAPLKAIAAFPVGACVMTAQLAEPAFTGLLTRTFSQITPEWEMKMEAILKDNGGFDFARADAIAAFAADNHLRLHGHALIWYAQAPAAFARIAGSKARFGAAFDAYIRTVAGRYAGRVSGWDVVNEPVAEDGEGYRDSLWRSELGMDYVARAFHAARTAEPTAPLFLNDYNLETNPKKRARFLRLAETLLKDGAPLGGLGTQSHLDIGVQPGAVRGAIRDLATLGLPIHVSELDVSTRGERFALLGPAERLARQAQLVGEAGEAFAALPAAQRYAITVWGVRDRDSWLRRGDEAHDGSDQPLLFDGAGRQKPAYRALAQAL